MDMKQYMINMAEKAISFAKTGTVYISIVAALSAAEIGLRAGIEAIDNTPKQTIEARLESKGHIVLAQTKGKLLYGVFRTGDGRTMKLYDTQSILDGKLLCNSEIPHMNQGKDYRLRVRESELLGKYLVRVEKK